MTDSIVWGPEIRVDGKRPEWLGRKDSVQTSPGNCDFITHATQASICWRGVAAIRLPADHPHYSKAPTTPAVDWSRPIEAVHEDGRVMSVNVNSLPDWEGCREIIPALDGYDVFNSDGSNWSEGPWRIRNVQPTTPELDPALWDRMVALVRMCAEWKNYVVAPGQDNRLAVAANEARAIVADLPKPVHPDWQTAKAIVAEEWPSAAPENEHALHRAAWLGIRSARGEQA